MTGRSAGTLAVGIVLALALASAAVWLVRPDPPPLPPPRGAAPSTQAEAHDPHQELLEAAEASQGLKAVTVDYPFSEAIFPPGFPPPTFLWHDAAETADAWLVDAAADGDAKPIRAITLGDAPAAEPDTPPEKRPEAARDYKPTAYQASARRWQPEPELWEAIKRASAGRAARVTIVGFGRDEPARPLSRGVVSIRTSADPVGAPIFYRDVPLPFIHALRNLRSIRWRLGDVASPEPPPALLADMKVCGNCHSFTADGKTLAMDVDYGNDKGSYVIAAIEPETVLTRDKVITWSDYRREDNRLTFGLLSQISPDGRYVVSTVKDRSVFSPVDDLFYSQRFFPVMGILVVYDRQTRKFASLPGADDPRYVQSNPAWSPDGETILFAHSEAYELKNLKDKSAAVIKREEAQEFFEGGRKFRYDICRIPFTGGKGGRAEPLRGASGNGRSNYFPRYSPDGKWVVFCQADTFMLLQPGSELYILPAAGGEPRKMRCNLTGKMNSWHSWSPNGRWLVFASKANGPYTQLWLTHVAADGTDAPPVLLERFTAPDRAANIPEFVNVEPDQFAAIRQEFADYYTHLRVGLKHLKSGEHAEALAELRLVLQEKPDHLRATYLTALCLSEMGREAEAIRTARKGIELSPDSLHSHRLLGTLLCRRGRYKEGIHHLDLVLKARPQELVAANKLAWVLATCPDATYRDGPRAVELGERICTTTRNSVPAMLDSLAAAYAEVGRFELAAVTVRRALAILSRHPAASTRELESRLRLYRAGKAYREAVAPPE